MIISSRGNFLMTLTLKCKSRRRTSNGKRDSVALNALDRVLLLEGTQRFEVMCKLLRTVGRNRRLHSLRRVLIEELVQNVIEMIRIIVVDIPDVLPRREKRPQMTFLDMERLLEGMGMSCSERFRFQSFNQLRRLADGFRLPMGTIYFHQKGYKSNREEILMIGLIRLSYPSRWCDLYPFFPGAKRYFLSAAFHWFLDFMVYNWGYLLLNNTHFWLPYLMESCDKIRLKLQILNYPHWRQFHPPMDRPNGFRVALFIDNTMFAFNRPAGNTTDGPAAPRVPDEIQEAWYSGWKKLHGMKWQTTIMANGMDFVIFGPLSVRRNDNTSLALSKIEEHLVELQEGEEIMLMMHGDSAYSNSIVMHVGGGRGMSSVRESIEWSYKDIKEQWKYCDYSRVMQLRKQPVAKIMFICMLLRNAYVTLCGSQISDFFTMAPPTLEEWLSQGPAARPIPDNSIFSPNYVADDVMADDEDDD